jgi:tetratricopeptide (TPR) repeat protein
MVPEGHFRKGLEALNDGRMREARDHFRAAIAVEKDQGPARPQMRYVSYYGLSLVLTEGPSRMAVGFCEQAASRDSFDPVLQLNLGRVYLVAGMTTRALAAFESGLRLDPSNKRLQAELVRADRRARPTLPRLGRDHPINRSLGRLRASLFPRRPRAGEPNR